MPVDNHLSISPGATDIYLVPADSGIGIAHPIALCCFSLSKSCRVAVFSGDKDGVHDVTTCDVHLILSESHNTFNSIQLDSGRSHL